MMKKVKYAILGDPVSHSLSPAMQNAAFKKLKLNCKYEKIRLPLTQMKSFFKKVLNSNYQGFNVTIPHKENVLPYVDVLSLEAKLIGAVNTLHIQEGKIFGYNTDGAGYVHSLLHEKKWAARNKKIVILGSGGAARGIAVALSLAGAKEIIFANRTLAKAKKLAQEFRRKLKKTKWNFSSLDYNELRKIFPKADLLVNTTSGGMENNTLAPLPLGSLPSRALVSDIVYRPAKTPLLKAAQKLKLKIHAGLGMLLHQGALAFEIWTGKPAPLSTMRQALNRILNP